MSFITVYVTHESMEKAEKVVYHLLKMKLIKCANYFPIKSSFFWKGKLENPDETVSLLKAKKENWNKIKSEIKKVHPYEIPCIMKFNVEANKEYENWIKED
jgi:periplasmic divalent cation tolerance protein